MGNILIFLCFPSAIYVFLVDRPLTCILWQKNSCSEEIICAQCLNRKYLDRFQQVSVFAETSLSQGYCKTQTPGFYFSLMLISTKKNSFKYMTLPLRVSLTWTRKKIVYLMSQNKCKIILTILIPCLFGDHVNI